MRCCAPVVNRRRSTGSMSPKRIQSSPCVQAGEKSSPKKVKLGFQSPSVATASAMAKTPPSLFHLMNPPLSSTPKGAARKGLPGTAWPGHPAPLKGALGAGLPARKTPEDLVPRSDHGHLRQDRVARGASFPRSAKEGSQGDRPRVRSRKVQPVRKQLISRASFSLPAHVPDSERVFAEQCAAAWMSVLPQQKDREQHLRRYHQRFQQPPILQEKLNYQPLERFLGQYKPQEVWVQPEPPGPPPASPPGQDETMQLEDLDDSDFSEDSFSPGPSRRKPEAEAAAEGSQGSFFLHQRECRTDGREVQVGQELFFELLESKEEASLRTEETVSCEESSKSQSDWSAEDVLLLDSSPRNDTPEKPYCSQGDSVGCNRSDTEDPPLRQNLLCCIGLDLGCSEASGSQSENAAQISPFARALGSTRGLARCPREDSAKGSLGNLEKGLQKGSDLSGPLGFPLDFVTGMRTPLTVSLLGAGRADAAEEDTPDQGQGQAPHEEERGEEDSFSPQLQVEEDPRAFLGNKASPPAPERETDPCRRQTVRPLSPQAKWLSQFSYGPKALPSLGDASPLSELHGCVCGFSAGDAGPAEVLSPRKGKEGLLLLGNPQGGEVVTDTEAATIASLSSPGPFRLGGKDCSDPTTLLKHVDALEQAFVSRASENQEPSGESLPPQPGLEVRKRERSPSREPFELTLSSEETGPSKDRSVSEGSVQKSPEAAEQDSGTNVRSPQSCLKDASKRLLCKEASGRQLVIQIRQEQLDEMAALALREEGLIRQMSDLDLEDFVMKLDGILMLKLKCIQGLRTRLQPLLAAWQRMSPP